MEEILFLILPVYFIIGAIVTFTVNKHKGESERNHNWLKYSTYLLIVSGLFVSIIVNKVIFHFLGIVIILFGYGEIINLILRSRKFLTGLISLMAFTLAFYLFSQFTLLDNHQLFFVVMIVTVFDAFSQLAGQLLGKRKLVPEISPMKTFEGLAGGYLFAALTAIYCVFYLASTSNSLLIFVLPVLILGISDPLAGLFGVYYKAKTRNVVFQGYDFEKTFLGSFVFFSSAFLVSGVTLFFFDFELPKILFLSIVLAGLTTLIELVTPYGLDNLSVPVFAAILLLWIH